MSNFRAPAYPLITVDPYFSIWSFGDKLYGDRPRHWTGAANSMTGMLRYGDKCLRFMGRTVPHDRYYCAEPDPIPQTGVKCTPTKTEYTFENDDLILTVGFVTPLLIDEPLILSRPVSFITYDITHKGDTPLDTALYFDISAECCVNVPTQSVILYKDTHSLRMGNVEQAPLTKCGDDLRIDYGFLHLADENAYFGRAIRARENFARFGIDYPHPEWDVLHCDNAYSVLDYCPVMATVRRDSHGIITVAYDDGKSIEYFGRQLDAYYKSNGDSFHSMLEKTLGEAEEILEKCRRFDEESVARAKKVSDKYADMFPLFYRQSVGAHKLCYDEKGMLFISKECYSNGCAATVDVTYPSMPLFYAFNTDLLKGLLRPIFDFARSDGWDYDFAPHDAGRYPLVNGQHYGYEEALGKCAEHMQMPTEESGNMLICVYAICQKEGSNAYALANRDLLDRWAKYLAGYGFDPGNQLCTDDFGGHVNHNCNLSVKAIIALYCYGELFGEEGYRQMARDFAAKWEVEALEDDHYKMAFDGKDTWSLKYNLVWDKIWDFGLFSDAVYQRETAFYRTKMTKYGIPLDHRNRWAKLDWHMWAGVLGDEVFRDDIIHCAYNLFTETRQRVPLTDWYESDTGEQHIHGIGMAPCGFSNRTVVGGLAILMLKE